MKKKTSTKITIKDREALKEKAWKVFSEWIRRRDLRCFTCPARFWDEELGEWSIKGLQAGHFRHGKLDFDEININAQCQRCNHFLHGNLGEYARRLIKKYGLKEFEALNKRADKALAGELQSAEYYEEIIKKYSVDN